MVIVRARGQGVWDNVIAARWTCALALLALGAALLAGCSEPAAAQLPDITKLPEKVLSKDEQQGKVNQMIAKGQKHQPKPPRR